MRDADDLLEHALDWHRVARDALRWDLPHLTGWAYQRREHHLSSLARRDATTIAEARARMLLADRSTSPTA